MKKLYIENLGCAKNQVDAEVICYNLAKEGYSLVDEVQEADLIIVNTCSFIQSAKEESIKTFFELKDSCPKAKIILAGCLAQRYAKDLEDEMTEADGIFGNRDLAQIGSFVKKVNGSILHGKSFTPDYPPVEMEDDTRGKLFNYPGSAYLKISEGCNHHCAYCAIPLIRGDLRSKTEDTILKEAKRLVAAGIREINLIAQDLAAYGYEKDSRSHFCDLLRKLTSLEGDFKVRMLYIHPDWMTDEIIDEVKNNPKVLHYFDIPFQHASEKLLKTMNRMGNPQKYKQLVDKIKTEIPDAAIRTTIMLGFPGDSKNDFDTVCDFVNDCRFTWMGSFVYSLEEDTPAFEMTTEEEHEKLSKQAGRWQKKLEKLQEKITEEELSKFVGNTYDVLIEEKVEGEDLAIGRIYAQAPEVDGLTVVMGHDMESGQVYKCAITKVNGVDLEAVKL